MSQADADPIEIAGTSDCFPYHGTRTHSLGCLERRGRVSIRMWLGRLRYTQGSACGRLRGTISLTRMQGRNAMTGAIAPWSVGLDRASASAAGPHHLFANRVFHESDCAP